ncbi:hypothetical protein [Vibrio parahaemolyticus]|uniref:hypothetical protein n=1 Tax=Vibrio parahaemolyticus TaxID=670 RepID=UPI002555F969|nr:hypothetical protein [Vibrio parahaemolyticus]
MEEILKYLEEVKPLLDFFTALTTPSIAILGGYIAYQQHKTNKMALKKDLFDRRYAVFECVYDFVMVVVEWKGISKEQRERFISGTKGVEFLFDEEIKLYVDEIWERSLADCAYAEDLLFPAKPSQSSEHHKWFVAQRKVINLKFRKFISLKH